MKTIGQVEGITAEDKAFLEKLNAVIAGLVPGAKVLLYGSVARGAHGPESDYDLLVLTDEPLSTGQEDAVRDVVYDVELDLGIVASIVFHSKAEWDTPLFRAMPFHREVDRDAIVL